MSGFEDIRGDLANLIEAQQSRDATIVKAIENIYAENVRLWGETAALRDELHEVSAALGNRVESLSRVVASRTEHLA